MKTKTKIIEENGNRYTVSTERVKGKVRCLCMVDDEMYGEEFDYDGRFDHMSDKDLERSGLMDETYRIISQEKIAKHKYTITVHIKDNETGKIVLQR